MNFKDCNRGQGLLLPPSYDLFLGESHEAVVLAEFIDALNLTSLEAAYGNAHGGSSAYHPVMLLTILIYGYMNGTFSSRKIAKCLRQDLAFMYLAGNSTPDFRTLARFRKEKGAHLEYAFKEVVARARELGFIAFGTVSLDGTKIHASASKAKNETRDALEERIRGLMEEADRVDAMEDERYGDREDEVEPELKTKEGRARKKQELEQEREQAEAQRQKIAASPSAARDGGVKVNTTDPDARLMKMKRGDFANGYNVQIMTENGLVLASHVADSSADQRLLMPTVRAFQKMHGVAPKRLLADKGYSGETNYRFCEQEHIDAYIPVHQEPVDVTRYAYDNARDAYTDPVGRLFRFKQRMRRRGNDSSVYEHIDTVTRKKKYLSVAHGWQRYAREQKEKLASPRGKKIYRRRICDVEPAFANIKHNLRFTAFRLRGFAGVTNEWNLISIAHNLKKML
jgi:transposase